ncbi:MAG TPA: hypothetical protein VKW78_02205 [Terriglobales bacterium]|nr:hypothetical protein [Terriglobales bacterium]
MATAVIVTGEVTLAPFAGVETHTDPADVSPGLGGGTGGAGGNFWGPPSARVTVGHVCAFPPDPLPDPEPDPLEPLPPLPAPDPPEPVDPVPDPEPEDPVPLPEPLGVVPEPLPGVPEPGWPPPEPEPLPEPVPVAPGVPGEFAGGFELNVEPPQPTSDKDQTNTAKRERTHAKGRARHMAERLL